MEERIDYVDQDDKVIGSKEKSLVKKEKLNYRSVHIFVFNSKGKILICKRPAHKESYPNQWTSAAGGHVKVGESYKQAAQRELNEELGISPLLQEIGKIKYVHPRGCLVFNSLWKCMHDGKLAFDKEEIVEHKFLLVGDLQRLITKDEKQFVEPFLKLFKYFKRQLISSKI